MLHSLVTVFLFRGKQGRHPWDKGVWGRVHFISEKGPGETRQKRALRPSRAQEAAPYWQQPVEHLAVYPETLL